VNDQSWYKKSVKGIGVNLWAPNWYSKSIVNFDAERLAAQIEKTGSQFGFTFQGFTQDHLGISFFPTRKGPVHRNLSPGRDHMAEYLQALRRRNIKVFGYYSFPDRYTYEHNPDWRMKDAQGRDAKRHIIGALCPNSPYHDHMVDRIREVAERYEIDGILIDAARFVGACYCESCQRKYRERFGRPIPVDSEADRDEWIQFNHWRYECVTELLRDISLELKEARPGIIVTHNWFPVMWSTGDWFFGEDFEATAQFDDVVTALSKWSEARVRNIEMMWQNGFLTKYCRGLSNDKPVWIQMGRFPYTRDYQILPEHELKVAAYSVLTAGGCPIFIDNAFPQGDPDYVGFEALTDTYNDIDTKADYLDYDEDLSQVALYYSRRSEDLIDLAYPGEKRYTESVEGAYKALLEGHIPARIIGEKGFDERTLSQFKVIVIPNAVAIGDHQIESLRQFISSGGTVIATDRTSLFDIDGKSRSNFGLADVFGADYVNPMNYEATYIQPSDHWLFAGIDPRKHLLYRGPQCKVLPKNGANCAGFLELPITAVETGVRSFINFYDVSHGNATEYPAVVIHTHENGRCVFFAGDITREYGVYGNPDFRILFLNAVKHGLGDDSLVELAGPSCVEVGCFRRGTQYYVHLLNYATGGLRVSRRHGGPCAEEALPISNIQIKVRLGGLGVNRAIQASTKQELPLEIDGDYVTTILPALEVHEIVVFERQEI
jgi:hypothetical protein